MDDLPELPFEKVLGYLSLEDRIRARAVSRRWYMVINSFRVKHLCFSPIPISLVHGNRWISGAYAQNFVISPRFGLFFKTFGPTIFSRLKHLRLCSVRLRAEDRTAFIATLQSFGQLEELDLIRFDLQDGAAMDFELNLPVLTSIQLIGWKGIRTLTVDAPSLWKVKLAKCSASMRLDLVHVDSVKRLVIDDMKQTAIQELKNLEYLYCAYSSGFAPTFLSDLQLLKEIHLGDREHVQELFDQKLREGRADLKIHLCGLLLNGPDDLAMIPRSDFDYLTSDTFAYLADNPSRLADEIPFFNFLDYKGVERVAPRSEFEVLKRLTDLDVIIVLNAVQNVQRFLDTLKSLENVTNLCFSCDQSQELFDRLPEHYAVQGLIMESVPPDFQFLFRMKPLVRLHLNCSIDAESIRKLFEELQSFLFLELYFGCTKKRVSVRIGYGHPKRFVVLRGAEETKFSNLNDAIQFILEPARSIRNLWGSFGFVTKLVRSKFSFLRF